jgi:hypothetical protein
VDGVVGQLVGFQRDFEQLFLKLAEELPVLSQAIEALTAQLSVVEQSQGGLGSLIGAEVDSMVRETRAATRAALDHSERGLAAAASLSTLAADLAERLSAARHASLKLRLAGMNASFTAQGLGQQGAAFSVVNRALVEVADDSATLALAMGSSAQATSEVAARLGLEQRALAQQISETSTATEGGARAALDASAGVLSELSSELSQLTARGREVVEATGGIMLTIQRQDILRQGVDHVILTLRALQDEFARVAAGPRPASQAMAFLSFQAQVGRLTADLMSSLGEELEALLAAVMEPIERLVSATRAIARSAKDPRSVEKSLEAPTDRIIEALARLPALDGSLSACRSGADELAGDVTSLGPRLVSLEQIPLQINLVAVLMRIEIARTAGLARASAIIDELGGASDVFRELHATGLEAVGQLSARLALFRGALEQQRTSWDDVRHLSESLGHSSAGMRAICAGFSEQVTALGGMGAAFEVQAGGLQGDLRAFGRAVAAAGEIRAACALASDEARRLSAQLAGLGCAPDDEPAALRAIIERFTLFEHKQIASGVAHLPAPLADKPGELTLF